MSKARKIVASRSSMRADAGRPRLTARLSSAESAMVPPTASKGSVKPRPQCTTAAVKSWPATAAQRINTSARSRTPPRGGRLGRAGAGGAISAVAGEGAGAMPMGPATALLLDHQVPAMHRDEKRDLALLAAVGRLLHQPADLAKNKSGDSGQRQFA